MSRHIRWGLIFLLGVLIGLAGTAPQWLPLLEPLRQEQVVEEVFPCPETVTPEICTALEAMNEENPEEAQAMVTALLGDPVPAPANEQSADSMEADIDVDRVSLFSSTLLRTGSFTSIDLLHSATGRANIYEIVADEDVQQFLRLEDDFEVTPGPSDMSVFLSIDPQPRTADEMMAGDSAIMLGVLKGHIGAQNYSIPLDIDISQYASVVIYSEQFERIFSTATLEQPIQ